MLFFINNILDLIERYNEKRDIINHITLEDFIEDVDDINSEEDIKKMMKEIERRI